MRAQHNHPQPKIVAVGALAALCLIAAFGILDAWDPQPVKDDPLVRMPGTQPSPESGVTLEAPNRCLNCHAGFNPAVEPGHN